MKRRQRIESKKKEEKAAAPRALSLREMLTLTLLINFIVFGGLGALAAGIFFPDRVSEAAQGLGQWLGLSSPESAKGGLAGSSFPKPGPIPEKQSREGVTIVAKEGGPAEEAPAPQPDADAEQPYDPTATFDESQLDEQFGSGPETPPTGGGAAGKQSGGILVRAGKRAKINAFGTVTLPEQGADCLKAGRDMLRDLGLPQTELKVVVSSAAIVMARICASNGTVILTCRNDRLIFSPRRPRPDDGCR